MERNMGLPSSSLDLDEPGNDEQINDSTNFPELHLNRMDLLFKNCQQKYDDLCKWVNEELRKQLNEMEKKDVATKQTLVNFGAALEHERKKTSVLETRLVVSESKLGFLQHKLQQKDIRFIALQHEKSALETRLVMSEARLGILRHKLQQKDTSFFALQLEESALETSLKNSESQLSDLQHQLQQKDNHMTDLKQKLREMKEILTKADMVPASIVVQSPNATPAQKRNASTSELQDTEAACVVAVEGHKRMCR